MSGYSAIIADSFDGTASKCFFTEGALFFSQRLTINERVIVFVRAFKIFGGGIAANVAVYTAGIHVIAAAHVF